LSKGSLIIFDILAKSVAASSAVKLVVFDILATAFVNFNISSTATHNCHPVSAILASSV
jgi:hypothetical protein